jgi:hypothetical protein
LGIWALLLASFTPGFAQYESPRESGAWEQRIISGGIFLADMQPRSGNPLGDSTAIRYNRIMPLLGLIQGNVELLLGYATFELGGASRTAIMLAGSFGNEFSIAGTRRSMLLIPILLSADYTKAASTGVQRDDFNVASIGFGTGVRYRFSTGGIEGSVGATASAQFASEGFGTGTGFSGLLLGDVRVIFRNIGIGEGLAIGYRVRWQNWSMSDPVYDYRSVAHGPWLGIGF